MHLVMLQAMLPGPFEIVPLLVGDADPHSVAEALRRVWGGPETAVAVSSDLTHFLDHRSARAIDSDTGRRIETLDAAALDGRRACGFLALRRRSKSPPSATCGRPACIWRPRRTQAQIPREWSAMALSPSNMRPRRASPRPIASACFQPRWPRLTSPRGTGAGRRRRALGDEASPALSPWRATFVTLTENGRLRGCIGTLSPHRPLIEDALANTAKAGFADPRFPPLNASDLDGLRIDVSILSHPRPIMAASESELAAALEPDRDGLILTAGKRRALFLPSVWRHIPDARAFVSALKTKAGLDANRWPERLDARRFRVESFGAPWRRIDSSDAG